MISAKEATQIEEKLYLLPIEEKIKRAIKNHMRGITISLSGRDPNKRKIIEDLEELGYEVECGGCDGWSSMYYRVKW